ncbi:Oidioi.mRNA.OKI2018_I69.chr1.g1257.t1.cds [Oikopleura dioica]|uniref:DnaJ homolog subfamily C member 25 n=1 Tax=Oikopleura dioica TaxID=34765 RepID=A0ABN7SR59_OIKDI|nr:Oidioi.mRNA.OKI2018_I69.chr1.g1257.t1.cds [Oikopleura dioica]
MKFFLAFLLAVEGCMPKMEALVEGIYCGKETCYEVLEVDPESTDKEIKNAYKKLAKENHPDRFSGQNLSNEEKKDLDLKFQRIAKAYETLKSERETYDDFLLHPEEYYHLYYQYYRSKFVSPDVDMRLVFFVLACGISSLQWIGWQSNYRNAIDYMASVDKYRLAAKREAEARGLIGNKKQNRGKSQMEIKEEERKHILAIIEEKVDIRGGYQKPVWTDIFLVQVCMYPLYLFRWVKWHIRWYVLFTIQKQPFGEEEKLYLMKKHLSPPSNAAWEEMLDKHRDVFFKRGLWIKSHAEEYIKEQEQKEREEKANSARWKQYRRYMKSEAAKQTITFED